MNYLIKILFSIQFTQNAIFLKHLNLPSDFTICTFLYTLLHIYLTNTFNNTFVTTKSYFCVNFIFMSIEKEPCEMEIFFLALADKTRLRILNLMREGEICVCFLVEALKESQPKISRHLAYLRSAGIVEARRDGKWMHYKITAPRDDFADQVLRNTLSWLDSQDKMQKEYGKLREICCLSNNTSATTYAPKLNTFAETNMKNKRNHELDIFLL